MRIPENLCMLLPKALKMRAIKHTMALITDSIGGTKCAPAQMPGHLRHLNPEFQYVANEAWKLNHLGCGAILKSIAIQSKWDRKEEKVVCA